MAPEKFLDALGQHRAVAILRGKDTERAAAAMEAAVRAGFRALEFTLGTPGALELIAEFSRRPGLVVGAGTVVEVEEVDAAVDAGAQFIVSPVYDGAVVAAARARGVATLPGCFTPTEMLQAHRGGATCVKLFPAPGDIPAYVRAVLGPLPRLRIVPTNGVTEDNAAAVLAAGAAGVGFTTSLFDPAEVEARRFDDVHARALRLLAAVRR